MIEVQEFRGASAQSLVGRLLIGVVFLISGFGLSASFGATVAMMATKGIPMAAALLGVVNVAWLVGGCCLIVGYRVAWVASALAFLLVPVTLGVHAPWLADAASFRNELNHSLANFALVGGLLCTAIAPPGRFSLDGRRKADERRGTA